VRHACGGCWQRLSVVAIDFEEEGTSPDRTVTVPVVEWGTAEQTLTLKKITTCKKNLTQLKMGS